jgi:DNA repair protein RecN (Recombination protein N)
MLVSLEINNFALIKKLKIDFSSGFTIITGETGAGKSIILGALDLLRGRRTDAKVIKDKENKAIVEGEFAFTDSLLSEWLKINELDGDSDGYIILRREIAPTGRSRAFINDTPVSLQLLTDCCSRLIDIHSQHQNRMLVEPKERLRIIDALIADDNFMRNYRDTYDSFIEARNIYRKLKEEIEKQKEQEAVMRHRYAQLKKLNLKKGEQQELENRYDYLSRAEDIRENLSSIMVLLNENSDNSAIEKVRKSIYHLEKANVDILDDKQPTLQDRLKSVLAELKDISDTVAELYAEADGGEAELKAIEERINIIYEAQLKYKVRTGDELVEMFADLEEKLAKVANSTTDLKEAEDNMRARGNQLRKLADELTEMRKKAGREFSEILEERARTLGMPNLKFEVDFGKGKIGNMGQDIVSFMCAFNKNQSLMPIEETASGGETSRLMLCIKHILADKLALPTIIFDEIDTGISGEIANRMGDMMRSISENIQVMAITHLPQVAAMGTTHFKVYKQDDEFETLTNIKCLSKDERTKEIAGMLSGSKIDAAAIGNAESLLKNANRL